MFTLLTMVLIFALAFQAGQISCAIKIDRIEGKKSDWKLYFFLVSNSLFSLYMIIALYGRGINRGLE